MVLRVLTARRYCECFDGFYCDEARPVFRQGVCYADEPSGESRRRCGSGGPSPAANVGGVSPVLVPMDGSGGPSPNADVGVAGPVPVQMWEWRAQSRCRCGQG
jgi:hypothetical protein